MNAIKDRKAKIEQLEKEIREIQAECSHPRTCVNSKSKSNSGNYDPSADSYWVEHECGLCEKQWRTDQ